MEKEIIKQLKEKLEKEKEVIERQLNSFAKEGKVKGDWETVYPKFDGGEAGGGALEKAADEIEEYEKLLSLENVLEKRLSEIKRALEKIERGNYGLCEKCGKEIELERLKAVPETRFCQKCKR
jgi:DnaK suppressor protein